MIIIYLLLAIFALGFIVAIISKQMESNRFNQCAEQIYRTIVKILSSNNLTPSSVFCIKGPPFSVAGTYLEIYAEGFHCEINIEELGFILPRRSQYFVLKALAAMPEFDHLGLSANVTSSGFPIISPTKWYQSNRVDIAHDRYFIEIKSFQSDDVIYYSCKNGLRRCDSLYIEFSLRTKTSIEKDREKAMQKTAVRHI